MLSNTCCVRELRAYALDAIRVCELFAVVCIIRIVSGRKKEEEEDD